MSNHIFVRKWLPVLCNVMSHHYLFWLLICLRRPKNLFWIPTRLIVCVAVLELVLLKTTRKQGNSVEVRALSLLIRERVSVWQDSGQPRTSPWNTGRSLHWVYYSKNVDWVWNLCFLHTVPFNLESKCHNRVCVMYPMIRFLTGTLVLGPPADGTNLFVHADLFTVNVYRFYHYMDIQR